MLPRLLDDSERTQEPRPCLPAIRDLFPEHLTRPANKPAPISFPPPRSSSFSLEDLGSSLPVDSRPTSPAESMGWTSPRSTWSQTSSYYRGATHGHWSKPYSPRRHSNASSYSLTTPSTSSTHDQFLTLPPIKQPYLDHTDDDSGYTAFAWQPSSSSRRAYESHSRARSTSEAVTEAKFGGAHISPDVSKRRHTIGSARGPSPVRFPYPSEPMPNQSAHPTSKASGAVSLSYARRASITKPYPSQTRGRSPAVDDSQRPSPPTSGDDAPVERRKSPAKYQCQSCGKRFNRPSSLKIHHNTHTGEKPFACVFPGCGRHFSVMSNMRRHARIHGEIFPEQARESSAEEILPDFPSPAYSSASSTHTTPVISHTALSSSYSHSHTSSASSSPRMDSLGHLPPSSRAEGRRRHSTVLRSHPYAVSSLSSDDDDDFPSER